MENLCVSNFLGMDSDQLESELDEDSMSVASNSLGVKRNTSFVNPPLDKFVKGSIQNVL